jgi:C4-dicarboxylate transporter DctM subunit
MDPLSLGVISVVVLVLLFCVGIPIPFSLGVVGFGGLTYLYGFDTALAFSLQRVHEFLASFTFTAVPLFILMGYFAVESELTQDAFIAARVWLNKLPGGLASATVGASALFAACAGSGLPAAAALGRIAVPEMIKQKYSKSFAAGVVAASAPLAVLIPPSITMVIFGILTETSIAKLLIAGIIPGILASLVFIGGITLLAWHYPEIAPPYPGTISWRVRFSELRKISGILILFLFVIGSIYLGWTTPTEAAGFGAFATLLLGLGRRRLGWSRIKRAAYESAFVTAMIFIITAMASLYNVFLVRCGLVESLATWLVDLKLSPLLFLCFLSVLYIVMGCFIDSISMMIITIPIIHPILVGMNINLIWFGVIMTLYIEIAAITPPFGISVYALKGALGEMVELWEIFRGCFFFIGLWILVLIICLLFPQLSTWLPAMARGGG